MYNVRKLLALKRATRHAAAAGFYSSAKENFTAVRSVDLASDVARCAPVE
jgi:hypothetical protein